MYNDEDYERSAIEMRERQIKAAQNRAQRKLSRSARQARLQQRTTDDGTGISSTNNIRVGSYGDSVPDRRNRNRRSNCSDSSSDS